MSQFTIYHNPRCSNSRQTLAILRDKGFEPRIVEYLTTPFSRDELSRLLSATGLTAVELIRRKEDLFAELGLGDEKTSEADLIEAMVAHPSLINRPIVEGPHGARLCRPPEAVLEILP